MNELTVLDENALISPEYIQAVSVLMTGEIPKHAIKEHPGKGGKTFTYVSHVWAAQQVREAFNHLWSFAVQSAQVHSDGSTSALCRLSVYLPMKNGQMFERYVQEIGAFEGNEKMPQAFRLASAASRGFVRCLMRMFGVGEQFYENEADPTPEQVWTALVKFGEARGVKKTVLAAKLAEKGFTAANLLDRAAEAYEIVSELAGTKSGEESLPEELGGPKREPKPLDWEPESLAELMKEFEAQGRDLEDIKRRLTETFGKAKTSNLSMYYKFILEERADEF
jgi:hypothetical protein